MNAIVAAVILSLVVLINSPMQADSSVIRIDRGPYDCFQKCELRYDDCNYSCTFTASACKELCKSPFIECILNCPLNW